MDKDNLIQITLKLYKKTLLFPKKEPLRYKIREIADDILFGFISWKAIKSPNSGSIQKEEIIYSLERNLDAINSYLEVAKWQNWVSYFDILEFQEEYAKIVSNLKIEAAKAKTSDNTAVLAKPKEVIAPKENTVETTAISDKSKNTELDERKQRILEVLKEKEKIQVWEANEIFPKISKRTIRRDFVELLNRGLIDRVGERNNTFYKLKK